MDETEIKLRVAGAEEARRALARLGATLVRTRHLEDNLILDRPESPLTGEGRLLRLRRTHEGAILTYKGPRRVVEGIKHREEIETAIADAGALEAILARLGLRPVFRYQKYREAYALKDLEIVVDETPVGTFLEIEGSLEGIHATAVALGYGPQDYITESYSALFLAAGGQGDMVFRG